MLFTVPSTAGFEKNHTGTVLFSGFQNPREKIRETGKLESFHE
jgi:hypothetical protein